MSELSVSEKLRRNLKRGVVLGKLKKTGFSGLDRELKGWLGGIIDDLAGDVGDWAEDTYYDLVYNTPYETYNLRNAIDVFVEKNNVIVGVNRKKLLYGTPKELPGQRQFVGQMMTIPPWNYVEYAEKRTKMHGEEGKTLRNFTTRIWVELSRRNARRLFK